MDPRVPDSLDAAGDDLYARYRRGMIRRHIAANGRFLESITLESVDELSTSELPVGEAIELRHSLTGAAGPSIRIRIPYTCSRFSLEVDPTSPPVEGRYRVRPRLWVPLMAPIKYPGMASFKERMIQSSASPWLPQSYQRKSIRIPDVYYVAVSSRADNPCYYGGMALAVFSLEHLHRVSPTSIVYARELVKGFLAMEMNGRNGYLIRFDRWHARSGGVKAIRGCGSEELLGVMLGLMFYLRAEDPSHPMAAAAIGLRERVLAKVSRGVVANYEHPFMWQSYPVKHFEWPMYASMGRETGNETAYRNIVTARAGDTGSAADAVADIVAEPLDFFDYAMFLTSMILVLEGGLPESKKEYYAEIFLRDFIRAAYVGGSDAEHLKDNAYMGVVARMCNKFLNDARNSQIVGPKLREVWGASEMHVWEQVTGAADLRISACRSLDNDAVAFDDPHQWQHNLPLYTIVEIVESDAPVYWPPMQMWREVPIHWPQVWKPHNPHKRIGADFEWVYFYPQWFRGSKGKFGDFAGGFEGGYAFDEHDYARSDAKRYDSLAFLEKEVAAFRRHHDTQVESSGIGLLFLRMLLTHINPAAYPAPQLPDRDVQWPTLPFNGVTPLQPRFLDYAHHFRSTDYGWSIEGDKEKALGVIGFPARNLVITAHAGEEQRLTLTAWRVGSARFVESYTRRESSFDQVVMRKTSSTRNPQQCDTLVLAERAKTINTFIDDHWLRLTAYRVAPNGTLSKFASVDLSDIGADAAQEIGLCVIDYRYVGVIFKTRNNLARVKVAEIDFANNAIVERAVIDAEAGSELPHAPIEDFVWIGGAYDRVLINAFSREGDPHRRVEFFSRGWTSIGFGRTHRAGFPVARGMPIGAVTVLRGEQAFLVTASFDPHVVDGVEYPQFVIRSYRIAPHGHLGLAGELRGTGEFDTKYMLRTSGYHFSRIAMSRARFRRAGEFVVAGKAEIGRGKGMVILYGYINESGMPSLLDWNCLGSGDEDSVQMIAVCGDATSSSGPGAIVVSKDREEGLSASWWRYSEDFNLPAQYRRDPGVEVKTDPGPSTREMDH